MRLTGWTKLAWRDLMGAPRGSLSLLLVISLSIAAETGVRATADVFAQTLGDIERSGIAGDLSLELNENPKPSEIEVLNKIGARWTLITSTVFPVKSAQAADPLPAIIKAVNPRFYPFYGELSLVPAQPLLQAIAGTSAVVSAGLLQELGVKVGDIFMINGVACRITAVIDHEPDRFAGDFAAPLRAIVSDDTMEKTGILRSSTGVLFRFAFAVPDHLNLASVRLHLAQTFQSAQVFDATDSVSPEADAAKSVSDFLNVLAWFALALGAGGVIVASHLHVESRLDTLASLKCLGMGARGAFSWFAIELLLLGGVGGVAGCCAGLLARWPLEWMAHINAPSSTHGTGRLVLEGMFMGIALSEILGFAWLLPASRQRPAQLLRGYTDRSRLPAIPLSNLAAWLVFCAAAGISLRIYHGSAAPLPAGLAAGLLFFFGFFQIAFWLVRRASDKQSWTRFGLTIRHAARNLLRSSSNNSAVAACSAFIAMLIVIAALGQGIVIREVVRSLPMSQANLYLMGFSHSQLDGIRFILDRHAVERPYDIRNFVWFHVGTGGSGRQSSDSDLLQPLSMVACSNELAAGSGIVVDTIVAQRLGARAGSKLRLERDGKRLDAVVARVREMAPTDRAWSSIVIPCDGLANQEMFHHAGLKVRAGEIPGLIRELRAHYPALTVATPEDAFAEVANVVETGAAVVKFLALFTIASGLVVVTSLMIASVRQRAREIAILRVLGASRSLTLRILVCEFAALGSLAGFSGGVAGVLLIDLVLSLLLQRRIVELHLTAVGLAVLSGVILNVAAGWVACARVFRYRPLVILRQD